MLLHCTQQKCIVIAVLDFIVSYLSRISGHLRNIEKVHILLVKYVSIVRYPDPCFVNYIMILFNIIH